MANEVKWTYASSVALEASGASVGSSAFGAADDTSLASANTNDYPLADFVLTCDFAAAVAANVVVNLYRCDQDIDSTTDAPTPAAGYKSLYVGSFVIPSAQSASAAYPLASVPLSQTSKWFIENATAQTISAGWKLKAVPKSYVPGA